MATIRQRVADMGKAVDDVAAQLEVLRQDPVMAEALRQAATVPGGAARPMPGYEPVTYEPNPRAYATPGVRPPADDNMRGLE